MINNNDSDRAVHSGFICSRRKALKILAAGLAAIPFFPSQAKPQAQKMLIIYFSHSGNTEEVARQIQTLTKAPLARILPQTPFPANYDALVREAEKQAAENARPAFTISPAVNPEEYDVIFLGFPIWAYTMPMLIYSFLEKHPLAGKKIAPFATHMGSGLADAPQKIASLCPDATVLPGLAVRGTQAADSLPAVKKWLQELGFIK